MKRKRCMLNGAMLFLAILFWDCTGKAYYEHSPYKHIFEEEEVFLGNDVSSPFCDFSIDYTYLNEDNDSVAMLINRKIQQEFLGEEYSTITPEMAVDSFKNVHLADYSREIGILYQNEKKEFGTNEGFPAWYNRTYSLVTFIEEGHEGVINASANYFVDMGGAHHNQWSRWMNFDTMSGKQLTLEEVFLPSAKTHIEKLLLDMLICMQAEQYSEENITSLEDLQKLGFLQMTNMYIPDNFLLGKEAVLFLFNRYDIAPYAAGEIIIEVPYEKIRFYLKK